MSVEIIVGHEKVEDLLIVDHKHLKTHEAEWYVALLRGCESDDTSVDELKHKDKKRADAVLIARSICSVCHETYKNAYNR